MMITMTLMSPISHSSIYPCNTANNTRFLRRLPIYHDGQIYNIPVISGNSIRGRIRRDLAREFAARCGIREQMRHGYDQFYFALSCGGCISKTTLARIDPDYINYTRRLIPPLSALGAALPRCMLSGTCNIGFAVSRCLELGTGDIALKDLTTRVQLVRKPDAYDDKSDARMVYVIESIIPGTTMDFEVNFRPNTTEIEQSCIMHGINMLGTVGGQCEQGFGRVSIPHQDDTIYTDWLGSLSEDYIQDVLAFAGDL